MPSVRQNKASSLIQRELSLIFQRESRNLFKSALISVTKVRMSPDLKVARVYLSLFGKENPQDLLADVRRQQGNVRRLLGIDLKHQLRYIPELNFFLDDSLDYAEEIDALLNNDD
ncbi:MAG: 30S ribosome-binding factor RbfA [Vicingaceae bacterium]